jgi:fluoroacetyl-CoA thioesterase
VSGRSRDESRLAAGLRATILHEVADADTAAAMGSGDVPVLGTPRLLALAEAAAVAAVASRLAAGETTVGTAVRLEHRRPSRVGARLLVEAELTEVAGRRLVFAFIVYRDRGGPRSGPGGRDSGAGPGEAEADVIGAGTMQRVLVDRERFLALGA